MGVYTYHPHAMLICVCSAGIYGWGGCMGGGYVCIVCHVLCVLWVIGRAVVHVAVSLYSGECVFICACGSRRDLGCFVCSFVPCIIGLIRFFFCLWDLF